MTDKKPSKPLTESQQPRTEPKVSIRSQQPKTQVKPESSKPRAKPSESD